MGKVCNDRSWLKIFLSLPSSSTDATPRRLIGRDLDFMFLLQPATFECALPSGSYCSPESCHARRSSSSIPLDALNVHIAFEGTWNPEGALTDNIDLLSSTVASKGRRRRRRQRNRHLCPPLSTPTVPARSSLPKNVWACYGCSSSPHAELITHGFSHLW